MSTLQNLLALNCILPFSMILILLVDVLLPLQKNHRIRSYILFILLYVTVTCWVKDLRLRGCLVGQPRETFNHVIEPLDTLGPRDPFLVQRTIQRGRSRPQFKSFVLNLIIVFDLFNQDTCNVHIAYLSTQLYTLALHSLYKVSKPLLQYCFCVVIQTLYYI